MYTLPSVIKSKARAEAIDRKLQEKLERNLDNPYNYWQPKDHSAKFMQNLRKYHSQDNLRQTDMN